jgi:hypothetical protein
MKFIRTVAGEEASQASAPAAAAAEFRRICNRLASEMKWPFTRAWEVARVRYPDAFSSMGAAGDCAAPARIWNRAGAGDGAAEIPPSEIKSAADRLGMISRERSGGGKISFERAWTEVGREFPDLHARACGRLLNRAECFIRPEDQAKANKLGPVVLESLHRSKETTADRGQMIKPAALKYAFLSALELFQKEGNSLDEAFARLRLSEPVFWVRGVLSYAAAEEAPVPFEDFEADRIGLDQG